MNNFNGMMGNPSQLKPSFSSYFNPATGVSTPTNNIFWVNGIEGAKAWQLSPNSMAILLDSEAEGKMYIKVSDNIGMSTLRIFNYVEVFPSTNSTTNNNLDLSQYVKKDELGMLIKEILTNEQSISTTEPETVKQQPKVIYTQPKK